MSKPENTEPKLVHMSGGIDLGTLYCEIPENPQYTVPGQLDVIAVRKQGGPWARPGRVSCLFGECKRPGESVSLGQKIMLDDLSEDERNTVVIVGLTGKHTDFAARDLRRDVIIHPAWFDPKYVIQIVNRQMQKKEKCNIESFIYHWYRPWYAAANAGIAFKR